MKSVLQEESRMADESSGLTEAQVEKGRGMESICCGEHDPTTAHECGWCQEIVEAGQRVVYVAGMETCRELCNHDYHEISSERGDDPCGCEGHSMFAEMTSDEHDEAQWWRLEVEANNDLTCWCGAPNYRVCCCTDNRMDGDWSGDHSTVTKEISRVIKSVRYAGIQP